MKVKMLMDAPGSPDGVTVNEYHEGETYEVTDSLGLAFLAESMAAVVDGDPDPAVDAKNAKKATGPDENK